MTEREKFEAAVVEHQGKHGMLGNLRRNADGKYMSACEQSAWWAWQTATASAPITVEQPRSKMCRECSGTGGIERMSTCSVCNGTGKISA